MAERSRTLRVEILGDASRLQRTFDAVERSSGRLATGVGRATSLIGAGFAALGGAAIIGGIKGLVDEAREAEKIGRITEARIRSTGGAANVSAKDFDRLTTAISNKVGVDDDLIATGANMLLTFKGVRNEVGKGNDIFDQASKLAVDLAAGMNQGEVSAKGLETANIQLGKALEDPIRGIAALRRSGVSFTAQQQEQIKTLVESGKTLDAQKIILKAVGEQFAGTARAAADPLQRLDVRIGNIKESIGGLLVPAVERAAEVVDDTLIPAAERWWAKHGPAVRDTFTRIDRTVDGFFEGLRDNLEPQLDRIKDAWDENRASLERLIGSLGDGKGATDAGAQSARSFGDTLVAVTQGAGKVARALKTAEGFLNELDRRFQAAGKDIHFEFVVPVIKDLGKLVGAALWANEKMIAGAATVAEALHLPMAKSLRKAEQRMAEFRRNFNDELDRLDDERVNVTARAGITWTAEAAKFRQAAGRMAGGGPVRGPGGPTSDLVPAWLSAGEFVVNAKAVDAIGLDRLQQLNAMRFARGGAVDPRLGFAGRIEGDSIDRMATGLAKGLARAVGTRLTKAMAASLSASDGRNWGSGSWQRAIAELRSDQVPFQVVSTFRAGARTAASGSVSYHALNRAVDLTGPNLLRIWAALTDTGPTELIYSGASRYKSRRGWSPIGRLDPITLGDHWDHVHAAYGKGGLIPEDVFGVGARSGRTYGFHGGETVMSKGEAPVQVVVNIGTVLGGDARRVARELEPVLSQEIRERQRRQGKPVTV